jgi:hypothetical protein
VTREGAARGHRLRGSTLCDVACESWDEVHQEIKEPIKRGQSLEDRQLTTPLSLFATGTLGVAAATATEAGAAPGSDSAMVCPIECAVWAVGDTSATDGWWWWEEGRVRGVVALMCRMAYDTPLAMPVLA